MPAIFKRASSACLYYSENLLETLAAQTVGRRAARVGQGPTSSITKLIEAIDTP